VSSPPPAGSERDLSPEEHQEPEAAHAELRAAAEAYETFLGKKLHPATDVRVVKTDEMRTA